MKYIILFTVFFYSFIFSTSITAGCLNRNFDIALINPGRIYSDNDDPTMSDLNTRLTWLKCSLGQTSADDFGTDCTSFAEAKIFTWQEALQAAIDESVADLNDDWRLPNKNELATLVEIACFSPAINTFEFQGTVSGEYWTSTPNALDDTSAWYVDFNNGVVSTVNGNKNTKKYVRLVRIE